jgi:hypothetical protein
MKKINYIFLLCAWWLVTNVSCLDDLNTTPLEGGSVTTPEVAWKNAETYKQFVAKIYACFAMSGNNGPNGLDDLVASDQGEATFCARTGICRN